MILRVSCSPTGFICHSIDQKSLLLSRLHICNGMVIDVHSNGLGGGLGVLQGLIKGGLNPVWYPGGFPNWWQIALSRLERVLSASTIKMQRKGRDRPQESMN
eukprot:bmy_10626T0